jgi:hypothetical protein
MIGDFYTIYENEKDKDRLRKEAFFYFNDKYFKNPFQEYWIIEQTERFKARRLRFFLPGRVYTFQYTPESKDILSFYDKRPMVYIIGEYISEKGNHIVQGINLDFITEKSKARFLDTALSIFQDDYKLADEMSDTDKISSLKTVRNFIQNWNFMEKNFDLRAKVGLEFATRNYILEKIQKPVLVELEDLQMLPYYTPRELVGKPPAYVYQLYLKERQNIIKKPPIDPTKSKKLQKRYLKPGG